MFIICISIILRQESLAGTKHMTSVIRTVRFRHLHWFVRTNY